MNIKTISHNKSSSLFNVVSRAWLNITEWAENIALLRKIAFFLSIASVLFAGATYFVLTDAEFLRSYPKTTQGMNPPAMILLLWPALIRPKTYGVRE